MWRGLQRGLSKSVKVLGIEARLEASSSAIYPAGTAEDLAEAVCSQKRSYAERAKESKEHISARLDYAAGLKALRIKWREDFKQQQEEKELRLRKRMELAQSRKKEREKQRRDQRQKRAADAAKDAQTHETEEEARKEQAAQWRAAVAQIYAELNQQRKTNLLEQSRHWVGPEDLEKRIQEALDNPVKLYQ